MSNIVCRYNRGDIIGILINDVVSPTKLVETGFIVEDDIMMGEGLEPSKFSNLVVLGSVYDKELKDDLVLCKDDNTYRAYVYRASNIELLKAANA